MARRRWYRRYPRVVAAKKKWAAHISHDIMEFALDSVSGFAYGKYELVYNKTNDSAPTPTIIKTGNFKVQGDCYVTKNTVNDVTIQPGFSVTVFVMYLPEGVRQATGVQDLIFSHPEWIMAWKVIDVDVGSATSNGNSFSMTSRLKRNLNSGDEVALFAIANGPTGWTPKVTITFTAQFWTCAN